MDVVVECNKNHDVESGDIIVYHEGGVYIVTSCILNMNEYGLKGIGLDGVHWIHLPKADIEAGHAVVYKKDEYELLLRKKV